MKLQLRHIALIFALLLIGSVANEAWAHKVTYHILTLPFTTKNADGEGNFTNRFENIRVEAVRVVVDVADASKVGLEPNFISPLAENFKYYLSGNVTKQTASDFSAPQSTYFDGNGRAQIYQHMTTKYELYTISTDSPINTETYEINSDQEIFVTYTYYTSNGIVKLDGTQEYNIKLGDRFLCFNKDRANRPGAILASNVTEENLTSEDFTYVANGVGGKHNFHFRFKFEGNDPYNITIRTAYNGNDTFNETDKALNKSVKKWYKGASIFCQGKSEGNNKANNLWLASDDDKQYTQTNANGNVTWNEKPGFYRGGNGGTSEMNPIWNSFAFLPAYEGSGYSLMASKVNSNGNNWQPLNGQYIYLTGNVDSGNNPKFQWKTPALAEKTDEEIYEIRRYTFKVKTPLTNQVLEATIDMTEFLPEVTLLSHVPDALKRKYTTIIGAYKEEGLSTSITTFADVENANNGRVIWLKYTTSMPFDALGETGSYEDARWYTMRMNGDKEDQYVVKYDATNDKFITGGGSNSNIHTGENSPEAMMAFIGDPYELRIINRYASEHASPSAANRYIGCATGATDATNFSSRTSTSDIIGWEIVDDATSGTMVLRQVGTAASPKYLDWHYGGDGNPIYFKATGSPTRIKVVELEQKKYEYHIVRSDGSVAVMASIMQDIGSPLKKSKIPEVISSPLMGTPTFYWKLSDATGNTNAKTYASYSPDTDSDSDGKNDCHIYVRYTVLVDRSGTYNVRLNGQYIYYNSGGISIAADPVNEDAYKWQLTITDPYAMTIYNQGASKYVKVASCENNASIGWGDSSESSKFIVKSSTVDGVYEVMAAVGDDVDASTTYYNIGRNDTDIKIYDNSTYPHGYAQLRFLLTSTTADAVDYHLIDKNKVDLLTIRSRRNDLFFPADYRSPLVETYHYYATKANADANTSEISSLSGATETVGGIKQVYVTYDTNDLVDLQRGVMYLLEFQTGDNFRQEDGGDNLLPTVADMSANTYRYQSVYPYCNGDCNFFVYGREQYDIQEQGAASTRTRWAWYVESTNNDPYHVKICSRQTETFNSVENRGYFRTYVETFGGSKHVVTTLAWPGITGEQGTEYMVLGAQGQYQLVTTNEINDDVTTERRTVKSFEQYWKTFDTIRKKIFGDNVSNNDISLTDPITVPATPKFDVTNDASETDNRSYLENVMGFHFYTKWAYAKRWNGFNISGAKSKGWEEIEHWYQTVNMGEGYFDFKPINIYPALILIDQHGWEIMRKPLPSDPNDPTKTTKYNAIRPYNSPMVKDYYFWGGAKKRSGFHQYYDLSSQITVDDEPYTSNDLTQLPPYDTAKNIKDKKGNLLDQYVTYTVKDEYVKSYSCSYTYDEENTDLVKTITGEGVPFLIQQGNKYVYSSDGTGISQQSVDATGGMSQTIITKNGTFDNNELWYLMPNTDIDYEMGYGGYSHSWTNDYDLKSKMKATGFNSNSFDPYNIQISNVGHTSSFFVTNATTASLDDGAIVGDGSSVSLGTQAIDKTGTWHDSRTLKITNATFMAVQDAEGNMQLMPRFDQNKRVSGFTSLVASGVSANATTKLYRPAIYNYLIIDNSGNESLRYQSGGDLVPQTPAHFKSPLAKDYKYFKTLLDENGDDIYELTTLGDEITESFAGEDLTATGSAGNNVYIRYTYDATKDPRHILQGKWFTMQLNAKNAVYNDGIKQASTSKPDLVDGDYKQWQWKLLETPQSDPDPYAVCLFNRSQSKGTKAIANRFALLSHTSGDYALAVAGSKLYTYNFLDGSGMETDVAATTATETDFKSTSCTFTGTNSQVKLMDDVYHTYTYKVYTNDNPVSPANNGKYGIEAISDTQSYGDASQNEFVPTLPESIRTPLLESEDFLYYEDRTDMGDADKELMYLYGLYEDDVYVRYKPYSEQYTKFKVPNAKTIVDSHVARDASSHDASLSLGGNLRYNIIWYSDNMMKSNSTDIECTANQNIQAVDAYEWTLEGNDPYAIKIKSIGTANTFIHDSGLNTCNLDASATTFMLLSKEGYDYGVLQVTGDAYKRKLTAHGNALTTDASTDPTQFIIFALSTFQVTYRLIINGIGSSVNINYRSGDENTPGTLTTKEINGSTHRDLASYPIADVNVGKVSLGDVLTIPEALRRPNCGYEFYIDNVQKLDGTWVNDDSMNDIYKGLKVTRMGTNAGLLGKHVYINVVYGLADPTTEGISDFVTNNVGYDWYSWETVEETPSLARYTYSDGFTTKSGYAQHYTNDYLWKPAGDPYGFIMLNRYVYKNGGETMKMMSTDTTPSDGESLEMNTSSAYSVFEMLPSENHETRFWIHPVSETANTLFVRNESGVLKLRTKTPSTMPTNWWFGLDEEMLSPYLEGAGNVGGLKDAKVADYKAATLYEKQQMVYNDVNIVQYAVGYYRLHSVPGASGIDGIRYASGYTHAIERDQNGDNVESDAIPMHFYEKDGESTIFTNLNNGVSYGSGFTTSNATRGELPVPDVKYDPASIFYFTGTSPTINISAEGLNVLNDKMTSGAGTNFKVEDIGGACVVIHDADANPTVRKYLNYDQSTAASIFDLKFATGEIADYSKWCMEPANKLGLYITTHSGGDADTYGTSYNYASFYAPFDILLPDDYTKDKNNYIYQAFICDSKNSPWRPGTDDLHPKSIGRYNIVANGCPSLVVKEKEILRGSDKFVPAGTPVLLAMWDQTGYVKVSLPTSSPSPSLTANFEANGDATKRDNILLGQYLEQKLSLTSTECIYAFGLPFTGTLTMNTSTGEITATLPLQDNHGLGFYKNANPNKEKDASRGGWDRNNWYVLGNKVYYQATGVGSARDLTRGVQFVPVVFDDDEGEEPDIIDVTEEQGYPLGVYDLLGRKVATEQQVKDGTWRQHVAPGIYIVHGKKVKR